MIVSSACLNFWIFLIFLRSLQYVLLDFPPGATGHACHFFLSSFYSSLQSPTGLHTLINQKPNPCNIRKNIYGNRLLKEDITWN